MHKISFTFIMLSYTFFCFMLPATTDLPTCHYHGAITTLHGHEYSTTDMLIGGKHRCIQVYRAPTDVNKIITTLSYDPKKYVSHLKLAEIKEIIIPYPYAQWVYKHKGKKKYLLIEVIWQHEQRPKSTFLIEPKRRLSGVVIQKEKTQRKIPFSGLKKIHFAGTQK